MESQWCEHSVPPVDEMRGRTMQCGEEMQGDRWVWRAREQSGLSIYVGGIGGQLEASPWVEEKVKVNIL